MFKSHFLAVLVTAAPASSALADPPADIEACIALSAQVAKSAGAKIKSEAGYAKYYLQQRNLDSACGSRDFSSAEKIANEIRAAFHLD